MITSRNWSEIAQYGNLENWREILASLVTYATNEDFAQLCDVLGNRLEEEGEEGCFDDAALCYVCSGNIEKFVECCLRSNGKMDNSMGLQELIEKVTLLRRAIKLKHKNLPHVENSLLCQQLSSYATILANQGLLQTALIYLEQNYNQKSDDDDDITILHDRLSQHLKGPGRHYNETVVTSPSLPTSLGSTADSYHKGPVDKGLMQPSPRNYVHANRGTSRSSPYVPPNVPSVPTNTHPNVPPNVPGVPPSIPTIQPIPPSVPPSYTPPMEHNMVPPSVGMFAPPPNIGAWNDPPSLRQAKKPATKFVAPTPLTFPLGGGGGGEGTNTPPVQPPSAEAPPIAPPTKAANQQPVPSSHGPTTPTETLQREFPPEHLVLYTVLNGLLTRCKARANNNVLRRKVDDISRKLDVFYDLICQFRLSLEVLQGLHAIAQDVQGVNYVSGLARLNHMVSTSNMSEITSFMPGIKTLLQLGMQLKV